MARGALSDVKYGFRTVNAIRRAIDIARNALEGERRRFGTKENCAVVMLEVKNAFNSANWEQIMRDLFSIA